MQRLLYSAGQSEDVRAKYRSDYGVIADYLAYYKDKNQLEDYWKHENRQLIHVEQVLDMLEAFSDDKRFRGIKEQYIESSNKEERDNMCLLLDMCEERGIERGKKEQSYIIAKRLLTVMDVPIVAQMTGLSVDEVENLLSESNTVF